MGEILLLNKFFSDCRYVPQLQRYSPTKLCDGAQMAIFGDFLGPAFPASCVQHISDRWDWARKKRKKERKKKPQGKNIVACPIT